MSSAKGPGYLETVQKIYSTDGAIGFYRGCFPPLVGSVIFRSLQFSVYEAFQTATDNNDFMKSKVPLLNVESRVVFGGLVAGSIRSFLECPFEYVKVRRQTGQSWKLT